MWREEKSKTTVMFLARLSLSMSSAIQLWPRLIQCYSAKENLHLTHHYPWRAFESPSPVCSAWSLGIWLFILRSLSEYSFWPHTILLLKASGKYNFLQLVNEWVHEWINEELNEGMSGWTSNTGTLRPYWEIVTICHIYMCAPLKQCCSIWSTPPRPLPLRPEFLRASATHLQSQTLNLVL